MDIQKKYSIKNKSKNNNLFEKGIKGLDIDKNEYQEIILSNTNHPESIYNKK